MNNDPIFNDEDSNLVLPDSEIEVKADEEEVGIISEEKNSTNIIPVVEEENLKISVEANKEEEPKKNANKKSIVLTCIIAVFVLFLLFPFVRNYYYGIKYIDYVEPVVEENIEGDSATSEVPLESIILNENYNKFKVNVCSNTESIVNYFYTGNLVSLENLTINEIGVLTINSLDTGVCGESFSLDRSVLSNKMIELFGNDNYLNEFNSVDLIGNYNVSYDEGTDIYTFTNSVCNYCESEQVYTINSISSATTDGEYLYVYENFGLIKPSEIEGSYYIFANVLDNVIIGETEDINRLDAITLPIYKWTLKKETNDVYTFVSIEVTNE